MKDLLVKIFLISVIMTAFSIGANAQFKEKAFNQNYNDQRDTTASRDSVDQMWSFKDFFRGVSHKDSLRIGSMFAGATVFIGAEQMYNRQYWKLPFIYGGLGATIGMGIHYNNLYKDSKSTATVDSHSKDMATYMFASAGLIYWGTLMDGAFNYKRDVKNQPGKATIYAILLPGLGQAYNGEYWKIPVYWGCIIGSYHYYATNNVNYKRYKRIHNEATSTTTTYTGSISAETALYYRNVFRRFRDYSMVALVGSYLLQVIDANVFAYMQDFEVNDDLTMKVEPSIISPYNEYASSSSLDLPGFHSAPVCGSNAFGLKVGFTF